MGAVVVALSISLDGFFAGPAGELDWHLVDEELHQHFNDQLAPAAAFLDGRVMHELMAEFWPTADADPAAPAPVREFARIWRDKPKIVYSRTLDRADWNATIAREVDPAAVRELAARSDGDLVLGGAELAAEFRRHDLIDEYRIYVHPVVLGRGRPLFPPSDSATGLRLIGTRTFGNGVVLLHYGRSDGRVSGS
jgi:dihydrofolate reductase